MIILPRPFGLRHAQIIGAERGCVARVARFDAVHRAQRHAGRVLLAQLLETAGISDEFPAYARRSDARPVLFDKK